MTTNRMTKEEAEAFFNERPDFWNNGVFNPTVDFELLDLAVGLILVKYAMKGIAGIYQFYGPFNPLAGPLPAKFWQRADADLQLLAEGVGTRYFLEYTPEAESYFLAFDFSSRPLISDEEVRRIGHSCAQQLMSRYQQIERDAHRAQLDVAGRARPKGHHGGMLR